MGITLCGSQEVSQRQEYHRRKHQDGAPPMLNLRKNLPIFNNCYIFILTSLILLIVSSSCSADCTPKFFGEDLEENVLGMRDVVIKEGSSYRLTCHLKHFQPIKWTLNKREITPSLQTQLDIREKTHPHKGNLIFTEIIVSNATKLHTGEYKCTPQCLDGSNDGLRVIVIFGENPIVDGELVQGSHGDGEGKQQLVRYSALDKRVEIKCTATNVKSIEWVKGNYRAESSIIPACADKRKKINPGESQADFQNERDTPCTRDSERERMSGNMRVKEKQLVLYFPWTRPEDFGAYTCFVLPQETPTDTRPFGTTIMLRQTFRVTRYFDKGHRSITVIEGNKLHIFCNTTGTKDLKLKWYKDEKSLEIDEKAIKEDKIEVHDGTWFSYLEAEPKHRGWYKCEATHNDKTESFQFYVRVKDKLMPLWPFLGICGEVAVLCLIILIYEKRRNKQELEESDTDGSPEQDQ